MNLEADKEEAAGVSEWVEEGVEGGYEDFEMVAPADQPSLEARVTEETPEDVQELWVGVSDADVERTEEERGELRLENLKRAYQNAIGQLPYGIPSKELADRDWIDLADALATGEKRTVEGDLEVTRIDGRWYYSDHEDGSTFLKEHGARPGEGPRRVSDVDPTVDREGLMAKLEERFILGEISEETYKQLKGKYGGHE